MHGGAAGSGAPIGNTNALRHRHYTAEAIARRRQLSELIRTARATLAEIGAADLAARGVRTASSCGTGFEPGASFAGLANSSSATPPVALPFTITLDHWRLWIEQNPSFDWYTLTTASFETGFRLSQEKFHAVIGTDDPDLSAFRGYGGKMITYHGWADQLIFRKGSIDYFNRVVAANGGLKRVQQFDRLFMVPGMNHCRGGAGAVNFGQSGVVPVSLDPQHDAILALQRWVEEGIAPDMLIATTDKPLATHAAENTTQPAAFTRPLCPYPKGARDKGVGDPTNAANFVCVGADHDHH